MQCLLEILREQAAERTVEDAERAAMLALAEQEHVGSWAASKLRSRQALTPAMTARLDQIERDAAIAAFYWSSELKGLLRAFDQPGIRVVPLKGPLLAEQLYGDAALRVSRDLDLLVSRSDLTAAEAILAGAGFVPGDADDYHRPWRRGGTVVELHHDVENPLAFDFQTEGALRRAMPATFQGECCWRLAPEDELLYLCLHAARHRFERLSLVVDLQLAFEKLPVAANGWTSRPEVRELGNLVTLGRAMVRRLQPDAHVGAENIASARRDQRLELLADRLWNNLLTTTSEPLDWRGAHAFFLEIEDPGWRRFRRRVRHGRILLSRIIAPDFAFAARFGLRRGWQVRALRPVRLLMEAIRPAHHEDGGSRSLR
jgi:hypothetical protein